MALLDEALEKMLNGDGVETGESLDIGEGDDVLFFQQQFDQFVGIVVQGWWAAGSTSVTERGVV